MYVLFFFKTCFACGKGLSRVCRVPSAVAVVAACRCCLPQCFSPVSHGVLAICRKSYAETFFLRPKAAAIRLVTAPVRMF